MVTRKVKLAFVGGLDLINIHKPYPLSETGTKEHLVRCRRLIVVPNT